MVVRVGGGGKHWDAFTTLVCRHGPMVYGVCRRVLRDAQRSFFSVCGVWCRCSSRRSV
jgi:hypothetical protein